ncbi:hypothetical protein QQF64_000381 [Cirrhinus molitorella]|uniref:Uncharacterized protein n=1 Tax=Cirrhinus molitorella TaxID=172907 RepID=A0ABR3NX14_9TELE
MNTFFTLLFSCGTSWSSIVPSNKLQLNNRWANSGLRMPVFNVCPPGRSADCHDPESGLDLLFIMPEQDPGFLCVQVPVCMDPVLLIRITLDLLDPCKQILESDAVKQIDDRKGKLEVMSPITEHT